jgi:protein-S-isoprenylcysteine O-methyltransferase Ste14
MTNIFFFVAGSAGGGLFFWLPNSRSTNLSRRYRFLAFELLLGLSLLTREHWFINPLSTPQVISWLFWAAGLGLALLALFAIVQRPSGQLATGLAAQGPDAPPALPPQRGIYKRVRHPIYAAALFFGWGLFAKSLTPPFDNASLFYAFLLTGASLFLVSAARADETADYLQFGSAYALYVRTSKMLIPFIL